MIAVKTSFASISGTFLVSESLRVENVEGPININATLLDAGESDRFTYLSIENGNRRGNPTLSLPCRSFSLARLLRMSHWNQAAPTPPSTTRLSRHTTPRSHCTFATKITHRRRCWRWTFRTAKPPLQSLLTPNFQGSMIFTRKQVGPKSIGGARCRTRPANHGYTSPKSLPSPGPRAEAGWGGILIRHLQIHPRAMLRLARHWARFR
ncbi:unnamed protein product [Mycena citricolor]|uniref:Uncharacterized protein n=1 Tax=Mycena citricolor TaxID=2018698 RepID=A0AAD2HVC6_9AGAR|nr:unnamed protein product [Mycena citricolor]